MERVNEQSDLLSSEDEIPESILKEAIDKQFLNDNLYVTKKAKIIPQLELETNKLKSLRHSKQEDKFTNFGITATFQSFVAKKLDEILEGTIKLKSRKTTKCLEHKRKRHRNSGIKLLSTSKKYLTITEVEVCTEHKEKLDKRCREIVEDDDALEKFREAAVSPEYILSKSDTKAWINKRPEPEFKYKRLKNGTLIEI